MPGKKFQVVFSRHLKVEIASSSNKRLKSENGDQVFRRGNEGGGMEDVLTWEAKKKTIKMYPSGEIMCACVFHASTENFSMLIR